MRVLRAGQVFDGDHFLGARDVVLDGATIVEVAEPRDHAVGVSVSDLSSSTIAPGLIDAHQHLTWDCSPDPVGWHREHTDDQLLARARANARQALSAGITTVRDLGARTGVAERLRSELAGESGLPTVLASGVPITTPGGHCHFLGGECAGVDEASRLVAAQLREGVDAIKVMVTGGNVTPGSAAHESQFGYDAIRAIVEQAHAAGVPVAAHVHGTAGVADALGAGVDTLEHCTFMTADGIADDPALMERLAASRVPVSLTAGSIPGAMPPAIAARQAALARHARAMLEAGVACFLSTDAGIAPSKPHDVLRHGVRQWVEVSGRGHESGLAACTSAAADALGLTDRGRVCAGARADLILAPGDLAVDLGGLFTPTEVLLGGVAIPL